eukprot:c42687_g1_i1 orf=130-297(+)
MSLPPTLIHPFTFPLHFHEKHIKLHFYFILGGVITIILIIIKSNTYLPFPALAMV